MLNTGNKPQTEQTPWLEAGLHMSSNDGKQQAQETVNRAGKLGIIGMQKEEG